MNKQEFISEEEWNGNYTYMGNRSRDTVNEILRNKLIMVRDRLLEDKDIQIQALRSRIDYLEDQLYMRF